MPIDAQTKRLIIVFNDFKKDNPEAGQKEFAKKLKIGQSMVSRLLSGDSPIGRKAINAIVAEMGYSASWLINGEGNKKAKQEAKTLTEVQTLRSEIEILRNEIQAMKARMKAYENKSEKPGVNRVQISK